MVVHWRGLAVPLHPILEVANAHGVPVVEDCAQSLGARDDGFEVGARGRINAFSFQMNKVLTAGEGGMVVTDDPYLAARAVALHDNGSARKGNATLPKTPEVFGENYRMTELASAILQVQPRQARQGTAAAAGGVRHHRPGPWTTAPACACAGALEATRTWAPPRSSSSTTTELATAAKAALAVEGAPLSTPYGGRPIYLRDVFQHRRLWHAGSGPWGSEGLRRGGQLRPRHLPDGRGAPPAGRGVHPVPGLERAGRAPTLPRRSPR